jgi:hypothetical protein
MKKFKSNIILSTFAALTMAASATYANDNSKMEQVYKSQNVKSALINVCKEETAKAGKLTANEVSKYCSCVIESDGRMTNSQKWEIQSALNKKVNPATLPFVQKQKKDVEACFGANLTKRITELSTQAPAPAKK